MWGLKRKIGTCILTLGSMLYNSPAMAEKETVSTIPPIEETVTQEEFKEKPIPEKPKEPQKTYPQLELSIPSGNPRSDSFSNTKAYRSAASLLNLGLEYAASETGFENNPYCRITEELARIAGDSVLTVFSHELGHERTARMLGAKDVKTRVMPFGHGLFADGYCKYPVKLSDDRETLVIGAGLNQNSLNAYDIFKDTKEESTLGDDAGYFNNRGVLLTQAWIFGEDLSNYSNYTNISRNSLRRNITALALADPQLYNAVYNLVDFAASGNRKHSRISAKLADGWKIYLPQVSSYLAKDGLIGQVTGRVKYDDKIVDISAAKNLNSDMLRFGAKVGFPVLGFAEISPEVAGGADNWYAGAKIKAKITDKVSIEAVGGKSRNDPFREITQGDGDGWTGMAALNVRM